MRELFAIFGDPVSHSKSPLMHNRAFRELDYPGCYTRYLLKDGQRLKSTFLQLGLKGANITVPYKEDAYRACDVHDPFSKKVEAVNTIVEKNGLLHGYNTDAPGFLKAIEAFGKNMNILFLGAGGTAKSTSVILRDAGHSITVVNRSAPRLKEFVKNGFKTAVWDEFVPEKYELVVNMTSAGLNDNNLPMPEELLSPVVQRAKACIDVIYGKKTPFLDLADSYCKPTADGSDMLLYQGVIAFDIFTENRFPHPEIEKAIRPIFDL